MLVALGECEGDGERGGGGGAMGPYGQGCGNGTVGKGCLEEDEERGLYEKGCGNGTVGKGMWEGDCGKGMH